MHLTRLRNAGVKAFAPTLLALLAAGTATAQKVTNVEGAKVTINAGAAAGVRVGMTGTLCGKAQAGGRVVDSCPAGFEVVSVTAGSATVVVTRGEASEVQRGYQAKFKQPLVPPQEPERVAEAPRPRPTVAAATGPDSERRFADGNSEADRLSEESRRSFGAGREAQENESAKGVLAPAADLAIGVYVYGGTISAGGQRMQVSSTRVVKDEGNTWVITDTAKMPMGEATDTTTVEKGTLVPLRRIVKQGPVTIELAFAGGKATGTMAMGAEPKPISADLGGPLFADGNAAHVSIAALPLADGYQLNFRNFDVQKQKPALKQAKVTGAEQVTVPAGSFEAWKVDVTSAEGEPGSTILWIDKATRKVVKTATTLPQMGGAVVTSELQR